jgi:transcriptional regulator with XRE-family HTH domain
MNIEINEAIENISANLKILRKRNNYTQLEVSHYLEMERKGYQNLESGKIKYLRLTTLIKILNFYDIKFEELVGKDI